MTNKEIVRFDNDHKDPEIPGVSHVAIQKGTRSKIILMAFQEGQRIPPSITEDPNTKVLDLKSARKKYNFQPFAEGAEIKLHSPSYN